MNNNVNILIVFCPTLNETGAGKTTFLKLLAGKHMIPPEQIRILGHPPFHTTECVPSTGPSVDMKAGMAQTSRDGGARN
jgi:ABC-type uncharacterized transport system ATPase subunit